MKAPQPGEIDALLERWRNGEDVQDAMAHKLRHLAAGYETLRLQRDALQILVDYAAALSAAVSLGGPKDDYYWHNVSEANRHFKVQLSRRSAGVTKREIERDDAEDIAAERKLEPRAANASHEP